MRRNNRTLGMLLALSMTAYITGCGNAGGTTQTTVQQKSETTAAAADTKSEEAKPADAESTNAAEPDTMQGATVDYPTKTINITVPYDAGSSTDIRTRFLAQKISDKLGKTVTITNLSGAAGTTGTIDYFMKAPDPHEILVVGIAAMSTAPLTNPALPYKFEDFKVVGALDQEEQILYVCPSKTGIQSFEDLVETGKNRIVKYGGGGPTAANDIIQAATYKQAGMKYESIVTSSTSQRITDVLAGSVDVTVAPPASGAEFVKTGDLVPIAVLSSENYEGFEGKAVPSLGSLGYDYIFSAYNMILVNGQVEDAYVKILSNALQEIYASEDYMKQAEEMGMNICADSPETVKAQVEKTIDGFSEMLEIINN